MRWRARPWAIAIGSHHARSRAAWMNSKRRSRACRGCPANVPRNSERASLRHPMRSGEPAPPWRPAQREESTPAEPAARQCPLDPAMPPQPAAHRPLFEQCGFEHGRGAGADGPRAAPAAAIRPSSPGCATTSAAATSWCASASSCCSSALAFLLKFAADRNLMPIELRLAGVALGGAALAGHRLAPAPAAARLCAGAAGRWRRDCCTSRLSRPCASMTCCRPH